MDSSCLQLDRIGVPTLLCQYTYFLNSEFNKVLLIGFENQTFRPTIYITSLVKSEQLHFSYEEWACVTACIKYCAKFLNGSSDVVWYSSNSLVIESIISDGERLIKISNFDNTIGAIELNLEEFKIIEQYSAYLSRIFKHYSEYWFDVEIYYRTYVFKCMTSAKRQLDITNYFSPRNRCLNYFRIFNELPIVCKAKLDADLAL